MSARKGIKQTPEHIAKRTASMLETRAKNPWKGGRPTVTALNFWNRVNRGLDNECWPWTGPVSASKNGGLAYGRIDAFGFTGVYVHRIAYWLANGGELNLRKNRDSLVRHSCDNPICCNPKHLLAGTHADNMHDKAERGRSKWWESTTQSPRAKLDADAVREIREFSAGGATRKELAERFGVSIQTIKAVRSGRHYSDVI